MQHLFKILLILPFLLPLTSQAAFNIATTTSIKLEDQLANSDWTSLNGPTGQTWLAQPFVASSTNFITSVDVKVFDNGGTNSRPGRIDVFIYADSAGKPTGSALASGSFNCNAPNVTGTNTGQIVNVALSPYQQISGTTYDLVLFGGFTSGTDACSWRGIVSGNFGHQAQKSVNGTSWSSAGQPDAMYFQLYGKGVTTLNQRNDFLNNGLKGYWTLNGSDTNWNTNTTSDTSGQGNTGTMTNTSTSTTPVAGVLGQASTFNGTNNYVDIANAGNFDFSNTTFSVAFWVKTTGSSAVAIIGKGGCTAFTGGWTVFINSLAAGNIRGFMKGSGGSASGGRSSIATNFNDGKWHYAVVQFTTDTATAANNVVSVYADGLLSNGTADAVGIAYAASTDRLTLGARCNPSSITSFYGGSLDDVRIYNRALSANEVSLLYQQTTAQINSSIVGINTGLVGYWTFDGGNTIWSSSLAGTTKDSSGQGFTGTLTSMNQSSTPTIGKSGQGLTFVSGSSQYVDVTGLTADTFFDNLSPFTFSLWFKTTSATSDVLISKGNTSGGGWGCIFNGTTQAILCRYKNGSTDVLARTTTATGLNDGKWHFLAVQMTASSATSVGQDVQLYVDGVLNQGALTNTGAVQASGVSVNIGRRPTGNYFNGPMDEVRLYNRALTAQDVQLLYSLIKPN